MFIKEGRNNEIAEALEQLLSSSSSTEQQKTKEKELNSEASRISDQTSKEE